ncbi:MAG: MlaD family protein, partial [Anaerolineae bacterium]|nr:MlaD family protein [Anaerolineae bacterium]
MKISNEAKIGAMIVVVVGVLAYLTIRTGDFRIAKEGYTVKVLFKNIDGVSLNAPVMLNGLEVGKVEAIDIVEQPQGTMLQLTVWLDQSARLTHGTQAYVKNMGFLGEKYVGLSVTSASKGYLEPGSMIMGREPADLD